MIPAEPVIDFRVQPPFKTFLDMHFYEKRDDETDPDKRVPFGGNREQSPSMQSGSIDLFMDEMDDSNIEHAVLVGQRSASKWGLVLNTDAAELVSSYPSRLSGFGGVDPTDHDAVEQVNHMVTELSLTGVALIPGWNDVPLEDDDPALFPVYDVCQSLNVPVVITASHYIGLDLEFSNPVHLQHVAEQFPKLRLIVGHGSWPWTTAAVALAMRYPNVYLMPEFYMYTPAMPGAQDYVDAANSFLMDRILYSSCFPSRSLGEARRLFESLPLTEEAKRLTMYHNASALLGLS